MPVRIFFASRTIHIPIDVICFTLKDPLNNSVSALDCGVFLNHEADLQAWRVKSKIGDKESGTPRNPQRARPFISYHHKRLLR